MSDMMAFPDTVEEFMENYKIVDTDEVYTNGAELVPIFRMKQWFEHLPSAQPEPLVKESRTLVKDLVKDTISRQAAIDELEKRLQANGYLNAALVSELNRSIGYLKRLPSAERRGRWLKGDEMADYPRVPYKPWETYCSCCREIKEQSNDGFCGNCGAKMDEVTE